MADLIITESLLHLTNLSLFLPLPSHWKSSFCFLFLPVQLCCCSVAKSCPTLCNPMDCSTPGFPVLHYVLEFAPRHAHWVGEVMPFNHLILCHPFLLLPPIFPSTRIFSKQSVLRFRWPDYLSFSFSVRPFNEYSGLIPFTMDWFDFLAVLGTLKSLLQHQLKSINYSTGIRKRLFKEYAQVEKKQKTNFNVSFYFAVCQKKRMITYQTSIGTFMNYHLAMGYDH